MTNEELNHNNAWQAKLEDTDTLQEYTLTDKNAVWENLYGKLNKKQRPAFFWYRMAAASAIVFVIIISFLHNTDSNDIVKRSAMKLQQPLIPEKKHIENAVVDKTDSLYAIAKNKAAGRKAGKHLQEPNKIHDIVITDIKQMQPVLMSEVKTAPPVLEDSVVKTATVIAKAPKKLKIVHANELDDDNNFLNVTEGRIPARIKIFNQDIYTDYTLTTPNTGTGINIIKHKISPK